MLWAWQRPEDLSFIDREKAGVSRLVGTLYLQGSAYIIQRNLNGVKVPAGTRMMACVRIEVDPAKPPTLSPNQARDAAVEVVSLARFPGAGALQVDFDATASQRSFYRELLAELRRRLPPEFPLSITALGSWCIGDDWISHLPVDEAVPMLFRMGPDRNTVLLRLQAGEDFPEPLCRQSVGISTDEIVPHLPRGRRLYVFSPSVWAEASLARLLGAIR
jgi:hypothetical protein